MKSISSSIIVLSAAIIIAAGLSSSRDDMGLLFFIGFSVLAVGLISWFLFLSQSEK